VPVIDKASSAATEVSELSFDMVLLQKNGGDGIGLMRVQQIDGAYGLLLQLKQKK
jgi:hypothetical protein